MLEMQLRTDTGSLFSGNNALPPPSLVHCFRPLRSTRFIFP